jgi:hypothetical protein
MLAGGSIAPDLEPRCGVPAIECVTAALAEEFDKYHLVKEGGAIPECRGLCMVSVATRGTRGELGWHEEVQFISHLTDPLQYMKWPKELEGQLMVLATSN